MKKARGRKMFIAIGVIFIVIGLLMVWFNISWSPLKKQFHNDVSLLADKNALTYDNELFKAEDFSHLPTAIQKYVENCGYIDTPKMSYMKMEYHNVDFLQGRNGPKLKIDYTQYNFVKNPCRMAFIDSSMFGVPFEGYDSYQNGKGGMKGVIAKAITLFDQTGSDMDRACLVTFLAESIFEPSAILQDYISFKEISSYEVEAEITYEGQNASGIFSFNEDYEMISFATNDRAVANSDGTMEYVEWMAVCGDYKINEDGIRQPTKFQAVWKYPDEDFVYFDGEISTISYG